MSDNACVSRSDLVEVLGSVVRDQLSRKPRVLVGIDGPDGSGKTMLADALAEAVGPAGLRASIDGFHNPREARLRRGSLSPEGYYLDSFDYGALRSLLLEPFHAGEGTVQTRAFDYRVEDEATAYAASVPQTAALLFDGVFLLRAEVRDDWDVSVYLHVPEDETMRRVLVRDEALFGSVDDVLTRYSQRYLPGQAMYREDSDPMGRATVVIDNSNPDLPVVLRWGLDTQPPGPRRMDR